MSASTSFVIEPNTPPVELPPVAVELPPAPALTPIIWDPDKGAEPAIKMALALLAKEPDVYVRGGRLCRLVEGAEPGSRVTADFDRDSLAARLAKRILFSTVRTTPAKGKDAEGTKNFLSERPPPWLATDLLAEGAYDGVRRLRSIAPHPFLRPDGTVCDVEGYDPATECYCAYTGPKMPQLPAEPVPANVALAVAQQAVAGFRQVLSGYAWGERAFEGWLSALLTGLAKQCLVGQTIPGHIFEAPDKGYSKTTLAQVVESLLTGREAAVQAFKNNDEFEKVIVSTLREAPTVVLLDNITRPIAGDAIARLFTATSYKGRVLGTSSNVTLPNTALWLLTATNPNVGADIADRLISIRLVDVAGPKFGTPNILDVCLDPAWRAGMLTYALTLLWAYCAAGSPNTLPSGAKSTRFLAWDRLVRGAIHWATKVDVAATQERLAENSTESDDAESLFKLLGETFYGEPFTTADVCKPYRSDKFAPYVAGNITQKSVGILLTQYRDTEHAGWLLEKKHTEVGNRYWLTPKSEETKIAADAGAREIAARKARETAEQTAKQAGAMPN